MLRVMYKLCFTINNVYTKIIWIKICWNRFVEIMTVWEIFCLCVLHNIYNTQTMEIYVDVSDGKINVKQKVTIMSLYRMLYFSLFYHITSKFVKYFFIVFPFYLNFSFLTPFCEVCDAKYFLIKKKNNNEYFILLYVLNVKVILYIILYHLKLRS